MLPARLHLVVNYWGVIAALASLFLSVNALPFSAAPSTARQSVSAAADGNLPFPYWWHVGDTCDATNYRAATAQLAKEGFNAVDGTPLPKGGIQSRSLGGSYRGVEACGPRPAIDRNVAPAKDPAVQFTDSSGKPVGINNAKPQEWECTELVFRFMYLAYGQVPYPADGSEVVKRYPGTRLKPVQNGTQHEAPQPGDIISFAGTTTNAAGHTAIIVHTDPSLDLTGNGSVTILQQNNIDAWEPRQDLQVTNWVVAGIPMLDGEVEQATAWLHDPVGSQASHTSQAGLVKQAKIQTPIYDDNLLPIAPRCSGASDASGEAVLQSGQQVVVVGNKNGKDSIQVQGQTYVWVAYPDPCVWHSDFSGNDQITNETGAVGWVAASALGDVWLVFPTGGDSVWRNCWEPNRCGDQHIVQPVLFYYSADGQKLYAWWTGKYWDPHWFHVKDEQGNGIAVYGRDWTVGTVPACTQGSVGLPLAERSGNSASVLVVPGCGQPPTTTNPPPSQPTPTPTSPQSQPATDNAQFISESGFPTVSPGAPFSIWYTVGNNGTTTWSDGGGYVLACTSTCLGAPSSISIGGSVAPGANHQFIMNMTAPGSPGVYRTWWRMEHNGVQFGPLYDEDVTVQGGWAVRLQQIVPSCNNPGNVSWQGFSSASPNTVACTGSGLMMQQGQQYEPEANLNSAYGGYDANNARVSVHVHFNNVNSSTYNGTDATIIVQTPPGSQCGGYEFEIRPNGQGRVQNPCDPSASGILYNYNVSASADYDLMVQTLNGTISGYIDGNQVWSTSDGQSGGVDGLMVIDFAWPTAQVFYTNFELDQRS